MNIPFLSCRPHLWTCHHNPCAKILSFRHHVRMRFCSTLASRRCVCKTNFSIITTNWRIQWPAHSWPVISTSNHNLWCTNFIAIHIPVPRCHQRLEDSRRWNLFMYSPRNRISFLSVYWYTNTQHVVVTSSLTLTHSQWSVRCGDCISCYDKVCNQFLVHSYCHVCRLDVHWIWPIWTVAIGLVTCNFLFTQYGKSIVSIFVYWIEQFHSVGYEIAVVRVRSCAWTWNRCRCAM